MTEGKFWLLLWTLVLCLGGPMVTGMVYHFNQTEYLLQSACIEARGNWEGRQGTKVDGCRFAAVKP